MGLQNPDPRFESGCRLQPTLKLRLVEKICRDGGIGRRKGLKILRVIMTRAGSSPAPGTSLRSRWELRLEGHGSSSSPQAFSNEYLSTKKKASSSSLQF